jgi:glycerol-3-phosphate acyltransferase PlsY
MISVIVKSFVAYLLGSLVGGLLVGRLRGGVDIRQMGSGNAGGTNALRTQGKLFAFWVLLIDIGKGWLATAVLPGAALPGLAAGAPARDWLVAACGIAVILGHLYPLWFGFRGGKGVATLIGAVLGAAPLLLLPMLAVWLMTVILSGYVGLGSMLGALTFALGAVVRPQTRGAPLAFAVLAAALIVYTHRSNIARMLAGTEPRARRLWLLGARARSS